MTPEEKDILHRITELGIKVEPHESLVNDEEPALLVCTPTTSPSGVQGSTTGTCSGCGNEVNIAPSSSKLIKDRIEAGHLTRTLCLNCFLAQNQEHLKTLTNKAIEKGDKTSG